jgi:hypothetical protein
MTEFSYGWGLLHRFPPLLDIGPIEIPAILTLSQPAWDLPFKSPPTQ